MEVSYRRDLNHNYMILENEKVTGREYTVRMMEQNSIPELLKFQLRRMNGKTYFYYEITSRQPISQIYESVNMKSRDIERLLIGIRNGLNCAHQYLLENEDILLEPEFIYMNVETGQVQLCYAPYSRMISETSFLTLAEFILKRLDHGDRRAVELGYELFGQASQENFSLQETLKHLLRDKSPQPSKLRQEGYLEEKNRDWGMEDADKSEMGRAVGKIQEKENIRTDIGGTKKGKELKAAGDRKKPGDEEGGNGRNKIWDRKRGDGEKQLKIRRKKSGEKTEKDKKNGGENYRENRKNNRGSRNKIIFCAVIMGSITVLFAGIVYLAELDLTQTGGLAFLFLSSLWMVYSIREERKEKKKKHWLEEGEETDEEESMEQLLSEIYDRGEGNSGVQETLRQQYEEEVCGETRCLTAAEYEKPFRLNSLEPELYQDIVMEREKAFIGKKRDQVDIWLKKDCISRIHAKLEKCDGKYYLTDLNSMNGTFINGERLKPNERRQIFTGDKISFATLRYAVKEKY